MTERQEPLGGEIPIDELREEEHRREGCQVEGVERPELLRLAKAQAFQIREDLHEPRAPNEDLQEHHDAEPEANTLHGASRNRKQRWKSWISLDECRGPDIASQRQNPNARYRRQKARQSFPIH